MAQTEEYTPRAYQIELYEKAIAGNTLIYLPTGSGKTYIVVLVINKLSESLRIPWEKGGKRTVFLVNTVPLVAQQCAYIARHSDLTCGGYSGDMNVDIWDSDMWATEFSRNQVLVMTSQILLDILNHGYLPLSRINLIIFDECHHAVGDHPMRLIMKRFEDYPVESQPKVLGTSATLLNSNIEVHEVEETIHDLEITFHSKVITVDSMGPVKGYGKPREVIVYYDAPIESKVGEELEKYIEHSISVLDVVNLSHLISNRNSSKVFQPRSKTEKLKCVFEDIREHCKTQGLYVAFHAILHHMVRLQQAKESMNDKQSSTVLDFLITELSLMRKIIALEMKCTSELENMYEYSSDQVLQLFSVIHKYYSESSLEKNKFCCIIFVRRRFTAKILYHVLEILALEDDRFKFLIPQYVVGNSTDPLRSPYESMCLQKWSEEALAKFRAGLVNCLIATDVLDEGIDIPSCSLVVRYDTPTDFRAYVQSKGRGRHKDSQYVILSTQNSEFIKKYRKFIQVESTLSQKLIGKSDYRLDPIPEELKQHLYTADIKPFSITNSEGVPLVITEISAICLINRYCSSLRQPKSTKCEATWILHKEKNKKKADEEHYRVTIKLPMSSSLKKIISGDVMPTIVLAKRSAAMKACMKLYEMGQLSENLLPKNIS